MTTNTAENKLTAKEARALLLSGCKPMITDLLAMANGDENNEFPERRVNVNIKAREIVLAIIAPMMQAESDMGMVLAESTHDVISLLKSGTISIQDAKDLMNMLSVKSDIDDVKKLIARMDAMENGSFIDARPQRTIEPEED